MISGLTAATLVAAAITALFALVGPRLAARLPPAAATRLLVPASLLVAGSTVWVLIAVAFLWVAQLPAISRYGDWSADELRADMPFPTGVPVLCCLLALLALARAAVRGTKRFRLIRAVRASCRAVGRPGCLVVLDNDRPDAFATPGRDGRIVVTSGLLRALSPDERRALLAHETAHLWHRHVWWLFAAELAEAANPMLHRTVGAIRHAVERWADEDAARAVHDRRLVARTLARTALLIRATPPRPRLALVGDDVPARVRALLGPPPRPRVAPLAILAVLLLGTAVAAGTVQHRGDQLLDNAGSATSVHHHHGRR